MDNITLKMVSVCASTVLLGACGHRVYSEREVIREQPIVQTTAAPAPTGQITIVQSPAAPQETMPPAPSANGYTWVPGRYVWRGGRWDWESGQWVNGSIRPMPPIVQESPPSMAPTPGARWIPGYWRYEGNDWVWSRGHWE
jgi:hypothetical protein